MSKKLLEQIDIKRAIDVDTVPPKLRKLSAGILAKPLILAINCASKKGVFPGNPNKNYISNACL